MTPQYFLPTILLATATISVPTLLGTAAPVEAQPAPAPNAQAAGPGMDWNNMTPEQRGQARRQMRERTLRLILGEGDFDEQNEITPVVQLATAQEDARTPIQELNRSLAASLAKEDTTDELINERLAEIKRRTGAQHEWLAGAAKTLDQMTGYSQKPRLEAILTVMGFIGDEAGFIDGMSGLNNVALQRARRDGEQTNWAELTPEERSNANAQAREKGLRSLLTEAGIAQPEVLDAVVAFVNEQDEAREPLRDAAAKLMDTVTGAPAGDTEVPGMLAELRKNVAVEKERRTKALEALDAKIGYSKKPRLEAALTVLGIIGDEAVSIDGGNALSSVMTRRQSGWGGIGGGNWGSAAMRPVIEKFQAMTPEQRRQLFGSFRRSFDGNGDGKVDRGERAQGRDRMYKRFDRNGNGKLDPDELMRAVDSF